MRLTLTELCVSNLGKTNKNNQKMKKL